jgi:hypothetical protein
MNIASVALWWLSCADARCKAAGAHQYRFTRRPRYGPASVCSTNSNPAIVALSAKRCSLDSSSCSAACSPAALSSKVSFCPVVSAGNSLAVAFDALSTAAMAVSFAAKLAASAWRNAPRFG